MYWSASSSLAGENLKSFSKQLGTWISWSFQKEQDLEIHNPCITCVTSLADKINEKLVVLVKGKKYEIVFKEKDTPWFKNWNVSDDGISKNIKAVNDETSKILKEGTRSVEATSYGERFPRKEPEYSHSVEGKSNKVDPSIKSAAPDGDNLESNHEGVKDNPVREEGSSLETFVPETVFGEHEIINEINQPIDKIDNGTENKYIQWKSRDESTDVEDSFIVPSSGNNG